MAAVSLNRCAYPTVDMVTNAHQKPSKIPWWSGLPNSSVFVFISCLNLTRQVSFMRLRLKSRQVKRTPQDSINELTIWKMNALVVPETSVKSCTRDEQWIFYENFSVSGQIENLWMDEIKFLRRHLHQVQGNWAGRNFVTESRVNSRLITTNGFNLRIINSLMSLGGYAWPGLTINCINWLLQVSCYVFQRS